ncbi:hypothetical protein Ahy_A10g051075 isoform B [Arachis hypogaea]|uniref:Uncharacterized protein n=1 Tax=Arachis hypogaea TaxID=3818 RepID=A0A445BBG1_ARAHY|nr:hypothetical protein Ahy_A10g051075 isoform B [Arachis hypogaea]
MVFEVAQRSKVVTCEVPTKAWSKGCKCYKSCFYEEEILKKGFFFLVCFFFD